MAFLTPETLWRLYAMFKSILVIARAVQLILAALGELASSSGASPELQQKVTDAHAAAQAVADHPSA
jgi:hypothetical protein